MTRYPTDWRIRGLLGIATLVLMLLDPCTVAVQASDPYDALYDVIMTRKGRDGKSYAMDEATPSLFHRSSFPFGDKTYEDFCAALDAFEALPQRKIEAYSDIQRALLQSHLWKVFDATLPLRWHERPVVGEERTGLLERKQRGRREAVRPKIATLIQRLALTREEILALPNTLEATVDSDRFASSHDPEDLQKPFLPPDLPLADSSWIFLAEHGYSIPTEVHTNKFMFRSAFFTLVRAPGGREESVKCVEKLNRREVVPVGTQYALVEQAFLISDRGELILSPLILGVSLRAYVGTNPKPASEYLRATQCVAEFVMQPRRLIEGDAVMKALGASDRRFEAGNADSIEGGSSDPFEPGSGLPRPRLQMCGACHTGAGQGSINSAGFQTARTQFPRERLRKTSREALAEATMDAKSDDHTWKELQRLWQSDSVDEGHKPSAKANVPAADDDTLLNKDLHSSIQTVDPYDEIYDLIMVRKDAEGTAYGLNEIAPSIFRRSRFPFDAETFPKLSAALNRFSALTQQEIKAYGSLKLAILQRHLWVVFDATLPLHELHAPAHMDNRRAVQDVLASIIKRIALTKAEIRGLPDPLSATIESGEFPAVHDPANRFKPFLPVDLYAEDSSWVCLGKMDYAFTDHASLHRYRSPSFQFLRLPGGREATLDYIDKLNDRETFPVGTQFALIDQAFLISEDGEIVLSPLINSIQLRAYLNVTSTQLEAGSEPIDCVAEFLLQPRKLMAGNPVMRAVEPNERRFTSDQTGGAVDFFERKGNGRGSALRNLPPRLQQRTNCHGRSRAGVRSLGDFTHGDRIASRYTYEVGRPIEIANAIAEFKRDDPAWRKLQELWQTISTDQR